MTNDFSQQEMSQRARELLAKGPTDGCDYHPVYIEPGPGEDLFVGVLFSLLLSWLPVLAAVEIRSALIAAETAPGLLAMLGYGGVFVVSMVLFLLPFVRRLKPARRARVRRGAVERGELVMGVLLCSEDLVVRVPDGPVLHLPRERVMEADLLSIYYRPERGAIKRRLALRIHYHGPDGGRAVRHIDREFIRWQSPSSDLSDQAEQNHLQVLPVQAAVARAITCWAGSPEAPVTEIGALTPGTKRLSLACVGLRSVPEELLLVEDVEEIDLSFNRLFEIPEALLTRPGLRRLAVFENGIADFNRNSEALKKLCALAEQVAPQLVLEVRAPEIWLEGQARLVA